MEVVDHECYRPYGGELEDKIGDRREKENAPVAETRRFGIVRDGFGLSQEAADHLLVRFVEAVDHPSLAGSDSVDRFDERQIRYCGALITAAGQHQCLLFECRAHLPDQAGLAETGLTGDKDYPGYARLDVLQARLYLSQLGPPSDERQSGRRPTPIFRPSGKSVQTTEIPP
jgi:hypothetical protein